MVAFYVVMFAENSALLGVCLIGYNQSADNGPWFQEIAALLGNV